MISRAGLERAFLTIDIYSSESSRGNFEMETNELLSREERMMKTVQDRNDRLKNHELTSKCPLAVYNQHSLKQIEINNDLLRLYAVDEDKLLSDCYFWKTYTK